MATDQCFPGDHFPEISDELVDQIWSSVFAKLPPADVDARRLELDLQNKEEAERSHYEAEKAKAKFTEILEFWDAEHDREKGSTKGKRGKEPIVVKIRANIAQMHSWEDVYSSLQEAEDQYNNSSKFRNTFDEAQASPRQQSHLLGYVLPKEAPYSNSQSIRSDEMQACSAANKSRQDIISLVESLPEKVHSATQYTELYSSEAILQTATCQLYVKILTAMESIIAFWTKDRSFAFLKPLFLQSTYTPLQVELDDMRKASENVESTIQLCNARRLDQVSDGVKSSQAIMHEVKTALKHLFAQYYMNSKWFREVFIQTQQLIIQPPTRRAYVTIKEIQKYLENTAPFSSARAGTSHSPLQQVLQAGASMIDEEQNRTTWVISDPKVFEWFKSRRSRALVIYGNCSIQRISPLSVFCALLIEILRKLEPMIVLHHFCGLNMSRNSAENEELGSSAMIEMLIYQLTKQWKFGELECLSADETQVLKNSGVCVTDDFLFSIFSKMVRALPRRQPIFIVIDGINYYETQKLCQQTMKLIKKLVKLLGAPASVKLLVTSTTRILDVSKYFEDDEKLMLPADPAPRGIGPANQQLKRRFTFRRSAKSS